MSSSGQCYILAMNYKIAYCGIEGAFANIAARNIFPSEELVSFSSFAQAYDAVEKGMCHFAVLPLENSFAGDVRGVFDLLFRGPLFISNVFEFRISQTLLGVEGAEISDIKTVYSHQQALDQCTQFIADHGFQTIPFVNTAMAAKEVAQKGDKASAAIASEEAGRLYGLKVLAKGINQDTENTTRFAVLSQNAFEGQDDAPKYVSYLMFNVKNVPGALSSAIKIISKKDYNLISLHSHPVQNAPWEYYFYAEVEGSLMSRNGQKLIDKLKKCCLSVKVIGQIPERQEA